MIGSARVEVTYDGPETLAAIDMFIRTSYYKYSLDSVSNSLQKKRQLKMWTLALDSLESIG